MTHKQTGLSVRWERIKVRFYQMPRWKQNCFYAGCIVVGILVGFLIDNGKTIIESITK